MFKTPILFLIFNRPDKTSIVFEKIRQIKPKYLYVAADGPRNELDRQKCNEVKRVVEKINWDCEIRTLYRDTNLGCGRAVSEGITWFFDHVEQGIILEDDCLPDLSFFNFCEVLLEKYKEDNHIWHISGNNFQNGHIRGNGSYYGSLYSHIWGWATWKSRWQRYTVDIKRYDMARDVLPYTIDKRVSNYFMRRKKQVEMGEKNTWDYQWLFCMWQNKGVALLPNVNLVSNIGFGGSATNTFNESKLSNIPTNSLKEIIHPDTLEIDKKADLYTFENVFYKTKWKKIKEYIYNIYAK